MDPRLIALGLPELLEDSDSLLALTDEQIEFIYDVRSEAAAILQEDETDEAAIDTLYMAHMTLSTSLLLRALSNIDDAYNLPTPQQVARRWSGSPLRLVEKASLKELMLPTESIEMLTKCGLPEQANPGITFENAPVSMSSVAEANEDPEAGEFFAPYWRIGTTVEGDAICLDERGDGIVLQLERDWAYMSQVYVNVSVGHLLLCLEAWRTFEEAGPAPSQEAIDNFIEEIENVDGAALSDGAYWANMLALRLQ